MVPKVDIPVVSITVLRHTNRHFRYVASVTNGTSRSSPNVQLEVVGAGSVSVSITSPCVVRLKLMGHNNIRYDK